MPAGSRLELYKYYVNEICEAFGKAHFGAYPAQWRYVMVGLMTIDYTQRPPHYQYALQDAAVQEVKTLWERVKANCQAYLSPPDPFENADLFPASFKVYYGNNALAAIRYMEERWAEGTNVVHFKLAAYKWLGVVAQNPDGNMQEAANFLAGLIKMRDHYGSSGISVTFPLLDLDDTNGPYYEKLNEIAGRRLRTVSTGLNQHNARLYSIGHPSQMLSSRQHRIYGQRRCM